MKISMIMPSKLANINFENDEKELESIGGIEAKRKLQSLQRKGEDRKN